MIVMIVHQGACCIFYMNSYDFLVDANLKTFEQYVDSMRRQNA